MVLLKMLMEIALPEMGELLVIIMMMSSPSERAKVLLPKFCLETAVLRPESLLLIFFSRSK